MQKEKPPKQNRQKKRKPKQSSQKRKPKVSKVSSANGVSGNIIEINPICEVNFLASLRKFMRKRNKGRALSRPKNQRQALLKALATALFLNGKIKTTEAKAKELRSVSEKMITRARDKKMSDRRVLGQVLSPLVLKKLMDEIAPKYVDRQGGYTRITKMGPRKSDGANMVIIELV